MRTIFVGGPGRSGTSFVAAQLGTHPSVGTLPGIELKLFTEKGGLLDLHHSLVCAYSPNRATVALRQFRGVVDALVHGRFGQQALGEIAAPDLWHEASEAFVTNLLKDGHPCRLNDETFFSAARGFVTAIATICFRDVLQRPDLEIFLEKTPHALLEVGFLERLLPGSTYLHVMRDPRSIAHSLCRVRWGPDRIETSCAWVASYCEAHLVTLASAARLGISICRASIEGIAMDKDREAKRLCQSMGLDVVPELLANADLRTLNAWSEDLADDERTLLDQRLGGWAQHFGYSRDRIGWLEHYPAAA